MTNFSRLQKLRSFGRSMIALQIEVDVLMDVTMVHSRAPGDPRASHSSLLPIILSCYLRTEVTFSHIFVYFTNSRDSLRFFITIKEFIYDVRLFFGTRSVAMVSTVLVWNLSPIDIWRK